MKSPAKINLGLRVIGKRPDGYHELDTIFHEIDLCDRIEFRPADGWLFEVEGALLETDDRNLIVRAAQALSRHAGVPCCAHVRLKKRIPLAGGLGGGSSNASVTLHGLNRLWNLNLPATDLHEIAAEIGSDCPFFIYGGLARGRGRGEKLELFEGACNGWVVAVLPDFGVSTAWAFEAGQFPLTEPDKNVIFKACSGTQKDHYALPGIGVNSLENIVLEKYPQLTEIRDELRESGADVSLLSGTGSTFFGLFGKRSHADRAAHRLEHRFSVKICRTVGRIRSTVGSA